jgi:hypothetical protein
LKKIAPQSKSAEREACIAQEIKLLPQQRCQEIWKLPGFGRLKNAKRGAKTKIVDEK